MPDNRSKETQSGSSRQVTARQRVHDILEFGSEHDLVTRLVNVFLVTLIILNVAAFTIETVPYIGRRYGYLFELFNLVSVAIFTIEYVLRLWSSVELPLLHAMPPWRARITFAMRPLLIIDLIAILPFYLSFLIGIDLRFLRIFRLFRFLKLARYSPALVSLGRVFANERRALFGALLVMLALLLFASTGMYFLERHIQPEVFGSIPSTAWWAIATLTTVGFGDVVPVTALGRMFGGLIMIFGLGMFALPIGIMATGFSHEANRRDFVITWGMVARVPLFAQLEAAVVARIGALLYARSFEAGVPIIRVGDESDAMFFIASGEVAVDADGGEVRLGEGDFFGEMALLYHRQHEHGVSAITKCRLLVLDKADLEQLFHREPELLSHIRSVAEERMKAARTKSE